MFTDVALKILRDFIKKNIVYAQYRINGQAYNVPIQNSYVMEDGRIAFTFRIDHQAPGSATITEVGLYDRNGRLWVKKNEFITFRSIQEGILYRFIVALGES